MKERPIQFTGPEVNAIRDGRKTQTRRECKRTDAGRVKLPGSHKNWHIEDPNAVLACPYGQPGDRLWGKETFNLNANLAGIRVTYREGLNECQVEFESLPDSCPIPDDNHWRQSLFMPRWASRILLEITAVRIERLHEISEEDAVAEGCNETHLEHTEDCSDERCALAGGPDDCCGYLVSARLEYKALWESINGQGSWDANPWVWVIEFKALDGGKT